MTGALSGGIHLRAREVASWFPKTPRRCRKQHRSSESHSKTTSLAPRLQPLGPVARPLRRPHLGRDRPARVQNGDGGASHLGRVPVFD